jgi:hypothetical protein
MIARALRLRQVFFLFFIFLFLFLFFLKQVIDIFVSRHSEMANYQLSPADWIQIDGFAKILQVLYTLFCLCYYLYMYLCLGSSCISAETIK